MHLFFIRHFNDVDHFTPIVWRMQTSNLPVAIYCLNPNYDIKGDYRLKFLMQKGVKVIHVYDAFPGLLGFYHYFLRSIIHLCFFLANLNVTRRNVIGTDIFSTLREFFLSKGKKYYKRARNQFYNVEWAKAFIKASGATVLCFDWIRSHKYVVDVLIQAANEMSIPVLSLPHGVFLYTNKHIKRGSSEKVRFEKYDRFDHIAVQNKLRKKVICNSGVTPDKIAVLGSARYCDEWTAVNRRIIPRRLGPNQVAGHKDKLKIVFMTTRPKYRIDIDKIEATFSALSELKGYQVVIKPHTRTGIEAEMYRNVELTEVSELSSVELCEWADVILVIASSIIIEALKLGKPALYLKYLHANTMEYEELQSCWTIHSEEELIKALQKLIQNKTDTPYPQSQVDRFLQEIIYGGQAKRDVLNDYEQFVVSGGRYRLSV